MKVDIIAHPNSRRPRIETREGQLHVYIQAPAVEGRANKAVQRSLAKYFDVAPSLVVLDKGIQSKQKTFRIVM